MSDRASSDTVVPQRYLYMLAGVVIGAFMTFVLMQASPSAFGLEHACEGVCI